MVLDVIDTAMMDMGVHQHAVHEGIDMFLKSDVFAELIEQLGVTEDPEVWRSVLDAFVSHQQCFEFSSAESTRGEEVDAVAETIKDLSMVKAEEPRDTEDLDVDYSEFLALTPDAMDEGEDHSGSLDLASGILAECESMSLSEIDGCLLLSAQEPAQENPSPILQHSDNAQLLLSYMDETSGYQPSSQDPSHNLDYNQQFVDFTWNSGYGQFDTSPSLSLDGDQFFNQQSDGQYPIDMQPAQLALSGWLNLPDNPQLIEYNPFAQVPPRDFPPLMVIQIFGNTVIHNY